MERRAQGIRHFSLDLLYFGHVEARDPTMFLQGWPAFKFNIQKYVVNTDV